MKGVYDLPDESIEGTDVGGQEEGFDKFWIPGYTDKVKQICEAIDQNMAYFDNYMYSLKLADPQTWEYYRQEIEKLVDDYNLFKNKAYGLQAGSADDASKQEHINNLQYILDYCNQVANTMSQYAEQATQAPTDVPMQDIGTAPPAGNGTNMVSGNGNVITMEEAGPVVSWWDSLSPGTKTLLKAAAIGGLIWGGKKAWNYASRQWKRQALKAAFDDLEEPEIEDVQ